MWQSIYKMDIPNNNKLHCPELNDQNGCYIKEDIRQNKRNKVQWQ